MDNTFEIILVDAVKGDNHELPADCPDSSLIGGPVAAYPPHHGYLWSAGGRGDLAYCLTFAFSPELQVLFIASGRCGAVRDCPVRQRRPAQCRKAGLRPDAADPPIRDCRVGGQRRGYGIYMLTLVKS